MRARVFAAYGFIFFEKSQKKNKKKRGRIAPAPVLFD